MSERKVNLSVCYTCPICGHNLGFKEYVDSGEEEKKEVCPECGTLIDWRDEDEK